MFKPKICIFCFVLCIGSHSHSVDGIPTAMFNHFLNPFYLSLWAEWDSLFSGTMLFLTLVLQKQFIQLHTQKNITINDAFLCRHAQQRRRTAFSSSFRDAVLIYSFAHFALAHTVIFAAFGPPSNQTTWYSSSFHLLSASLSRGSSCLTLTLLFTESIFVCKHIMFV